MQENALGKASSDSDRSDMKILHCFADDGVESEALSEFGTVVRVGLDPSDKNRSNPIKADATLLPIQDGVQFDLGLFHPPCTKWSDMPSADTESAPNLIPDAREIAREYCDHYIIENKPQAPLIDQTELNGRMFGLPVEYTRAFETTFEVDTPPIQSQLGKTEGQPFFDSEHSKEWWAAAKGYPPRYSKGHLSRNCLPRAYVYHLLQHWLKAVDRQERPDYSDYDKEMDAKRAKESNTQLSRFQ
jgi:hypothetical protein